KERRLSHEHLCCLLPPFLDCLDVNVNIAPDFGAFHGLAHFFGWSCYRIAAQVDVVHDPPSESQLNRENIACGEWRLTSAKVLKTETLEIFKCSAIARDRP